MIFWLYLLVSFVLGIILFIKQNKKRKKADQEFIDRYMEEWHKKHYALECELTQLEIQHEQLLQLYEMIENDPDMKPLVKMQRLITLDNKIYNNARKKLNTYEKMDNIKIDCRN